MELRWEATADTAGWETCMKEAVCGFMRTEG